MSFFNELKRRNVFRVGIAYVVVAWLVLQVADIVFEAIGTPQWVIQTLLFVLVIGFLFAMFFAWAYELTPEGLKREHEVDRSQSIAAQTGRKLDRTIMVVMALALAYFVADKFWLRQAALDSSAGPASSTEAQSIPSIAVLPLADMSPQGDNAYFADGLTEELLNILAQNRRLQVAGRTSSFAFKGLNEDLRSIGEKLGVDHILEGSVRKDDQRNRVRITLQLINAQDGYHLWSQTYDRDLDDIFAIQEEIAVAVAGSLSVNLLGEDAAPVTTVASTTMSAYDHYLHGLQGINDYSYASLDRAVEHFQQALNLDPTYTPAQIGLIRAWGSLSSTGAIGNQEAIDRMLPLLTLLLQRDPENGEAHALMADVREKQADWQQAEIEYRKALELDPRNVTILRGLGSFLRDRERVAEGMPYIHQAEKLDPYSVNVQWDLCWSYAWLQNLTGALEACGKIREIAPENPYGYFGPSSAYMVSGDLARAVQWDVMAYEVDPDDPEIPAELAQYWLDLGDMDEAERWLKRALDTGPDQPRPVATGIMLLMQREQFTQAADEARKWLDMEHRRDSRMVMRTAVVREALEQGAWQAALDTYRADETWFFEEPGQVDLERQSWRVGDVIEMAYILKSGDLASDRAETLLAASQSILDGAEPELAPWVVPIYQAAIQATRDEDDAALQSLQAAFEKGFRSKWRFHLQHWFVFEDLRGKPEYRELVARFESDMERQRLLAHELLETGA